MASEAVTPPPSTPVRTSSMASSAPGILRSAIGLLPLTCPQEWYHILC